MQRTPVISIIALVALVGLSGCAQHSSESLSETTAPSSSGPAHNHTVVDHVVISAPAVVVTQGDSATINGTATPGAHIRPTTLHGIFGPLANVTAGADGKWSMILPATYGHRFYPIGAYLGTATALTNVTVIRLAQATMQVKFNGSPGHTDRDDKVWYDPAGNASASLYAGKDTSHPANAIVHDLMVTWSANGGLAIEYGYSNGLGFSVSRIDNAGLPINAPAGLPSVQNDYWCYDLNGASASKGISTQELKPGDIVTWSLGCTAM